MTTRNSFSCLACSRISSFFYFFSIFRCNLQKQNPIILVRSALLLYSLVANVCLHICLVTLTPESSDTPSDNLRITILISGVFLIELNIYSLYRGCPLIYQYLFLLMELLFSFFSFAIYNSKKFFFFLNCSHFKSIITFNQRGWSSKLQCLLITQKIQTRDVGFLYDTNYLII